MNIPFKKEAKYFLYDIFLASKFAFADLGGENYFSAAGIACYADTSLAVSQSVNLSSDLLLHLCLQQYSYASGDVYKVHPPQDYSKKWKQVTSIQISKLCT